MKLATIRGGRHRWRSGTTVRLPRVGLWPALILR